MRAVTFYHKVSGLLHPVTVVTNSDDAVALNTPADHIAIDHPEGGRLDHLSQRVDLATGKVVDYQPPQPSAEHEWDAVTRRWNLSAAARARVDSDRAKIARRSELVTQGHALVRRLALNPEDVQTRETLEAIEAEIHLLSENTSP